jgi:nitroreductase
MTRIADISAARRTVKLLPDPAAPLPGNGLDRATVDALIAAAGWAPFHRACASGREGQSAPEPWRVHALDKPACLALLPRLDGFAKPPAKVANMVAAADALLLITWLPEEGAQWAGTEMNMEHIAAAGAMIQTLLLAATEQGIGSYWSSGGSLATPEVLADLGAQKGEVLLGAIFLWPDPPADIEAAPGKLRPQRTTPDRWTRWVTGCDGDVPSR